MNLLENWSQVKSALLEGVTDRKRSIVDQCLENTKQFMTENTNAAAIGNTFNTIIPMIRRVIPGTIATEIVGVQPMPGPVGQIFSLRYSYTDTITNPANPAYQIQAGDEVFGSSYGGGNSKMLSYYSGTAGANGLGSNDLTANKESQVGNELQLAILRQTATAGTRKLGARWTIEAMQDAQSQHRIDIESEITSALSATVVQEIDREIIDDLLQLAGTVDTFDMNGTFTGTPNYIGDRHAVLGVMINKMANEIGRLTRMGTANWIVVSPAVVSVLQSASKSVFAPAVQGSFEGPSGTKLVGILNGSIKVYSYVWYGDGKYADFPAVGTNTSNFEPILMGLKVSDSQAGYYYCPYIPLMATGPVVDPNTMNSVMSMMTRYAKVSFTNTTTSLGASSDWFGKLNVANLTFA